MNYYNTNIEPEREREEIKKSHRTKFIIYLALWLGSGFIIGFSTILGALIGGVWGAVIFLWAGIIATIAFLILWVYHLIKWLNA